MENQSQNQPLQSKRYVAEDDNLELSYWSREFGIGKDELLAVLKNGGTFTTAVENYVKKLEFAV